MYLVAEPLQAPLALGRGYARGAPRAMRTLIHETESRVPMSVQESQPNPLAASRTERRARGVAATMMGNRRTAGDLDDAFDVEVRVSGSVRAFVSTLAYHQVHQRVPEGITLVLEDTIIAWCHRMVAWAKSLGEQLSYRGPWGFDVLIVGLTGVRASPAPYERRLRLITLAWDSPVYDADEYECVTAATYPEIDSEPNDSRPARGRSDPRARRSEPLRGRPLTGG
jgi:hypothetical protein